MSQRDAPTTAICTSDETTIHVRGANLVDDLIGQVSFTEVVTAQASAASARRALVTLQADRQVAAVALVQSLGGGWTGL